MRSRGRRRVVYRAAAGIVLTVTFAVVGGVGSAAQESPATPVTFDKIAMFTAPLTPDAIPPILIEEVPPSAVCIVEPELCNDTIKGLIDGAGLGEGVPVPRSPDFLLPPVVVPDSIAVSMIGGVPRTNSYVRFALPSVPEGEEFSRFQLTFTQTQPTFAIESPAFRAAVLAAISQAQAPDPSVFADLLANIAAGDPALAEFEPTGIEVCAVTGTWDAGATQDAATQPERNCILGATGAFDPAAGTWTFDLTFVAQAWAKGELPNEGIVLSPVGADNLAFGDPDVSTNFQIALATAGSGAPTITVATAPIVTDDGGFLDEDDEFLDEPVDDSGFGSDLGTDIPIDAFPSPPVDPGTIDPGTETGSGETATPPLQPASSTPDKGAWYIWLLVPLGMALAFAFERAAEAVPAIGRHRPGALTRLVELRNGGGEHT
jgi:hypothetical protein